MPQTLRHFFGQLGPPEDAIAVAGIELIVPTVREQGPQFGRLFHFQAIDLLRPIGGSGIDAMPLELGVALRQPLGDDLLR